MILTPLQTLNFDNNLTPLPNPWIFSSYRIKQSDSYSTGVIEKHDTVCTVIAEAVDTGVSDAFVDVELTVGASEASETVAVES